MKAFIKFFCVLLFLISCQTMSGQVTSVYLHLDRSYYLPGESVIFKAYFSNDGDLQTVTRNDSLHIVILDQEGLEVSSGLFAVSNNMITGTVDLPDILTEGNYMVVGYTNSMKNLPPDKMYSRIIEIRKSVENYLITKLSLSKSIYEPGGMLTAQLRFSGKENKPVPASFSYQLNGEKEEILNGNNKANNEGIATLKLQLPKFDSKETLRLIVIPTYKGAKNITGVIIPTQFNTVINKTNQAAKLPSDGSKNLNIQIKPANLSSGKNDKVVLEITVTDDNGMPVLTNLAISASNNFPTQLPTQDDNIISYLKRKSNRTDSIVNGGMNDFFTRRLIQLTQAPGSSFILQESNNVKKLRKWGLTNSQRNQAGSSSDIKKSPEFLKNEADAKKTKSNTLFWDPDIMTDNTGKASINFSRNDNSAEVLISVVGMAANGVCDNSSLILYKNGN